MNKVDFLLEADQERYYRYTEVHEQMHTHESTRERPQRTTGTWQTSVLNLESLQQARPVGARHRPSGHGLLFMSDGNTLQMSLKSDLGIMGTTKNLTTTNHFSIESVCRFMEHISKKSCARN